MTLTSSDSSSNARWSAIETRGRSSDRLRQILYRQDLNRRDSSTSRLDSSSHTLPIPAIRRTSFNSIDSMSSMSSTGISRKSSSSKLGRIQNRDSMNSLLSLNNRWKSTPPQKRNSTSSANHKMLKASIRSLLRLGITTDDGWRQFPATVQSIDQ